MIMHILPEQNPTTQNTIYYFYKITNYLAKTSLTRCFLGKTELRILQRLPYLTTYTAQNINTVVTNH